MIANMEPKEMADIVMRGLKSIAEDHWKDDGEDPLLKDLWINGFCKGYLVAKENDMINDVYKQLLKQEK